MAELKNSGGGPRPKRKKKCLCVQDGISPLDSLTKAWVAQTTRFQRDLIKCIIPRKGKEVMWRAARARTKTLRPIRIQIWNCEGPQVDRGGARGVHGGSALNGLILLLHSRAGRKILGASRGPLTSWPSSSWASRHCHCHCHCHRRRRRCRRRRPLRSRRCRCCRRRPRSRPRSP